MIALLFVFYFGDNSLVEKSFQMTSGSTFSLDTHKGEIKIRTGGGDTCMVKAEIIRESGTKYREVDVKMKQSGGNVYVEVDYEDSWGFGNQDETPAVHFDILLPDHVNLEIDDHKSHYDVACPAGRINIDTHKGQGRISGIRSHFDLDTHKGNFDIVVEQLHDFIVDTHKGRLDVIVQSAVDFQIHAESHKGHFDFKGIDVQRKYEDDDRDDVYYSYSSGSGENRVRLETHKGSFTFRFE